MKKYLITLSIIGLVANSFVSCKQKLKDTFGVVTEVKTSNLGDTVKDMHIYNGEDTLIFSLKDAEFNNGMVLKGDSVDVSYISGHGDTLRALLVHVRPAPSKVIDIDKDTTKVLMTR